MKNFFLFSLFLIVILTSSSCKRILWIVYGVKKPQVESVESIDKFLNEIGINSRTFYLCKDTASFSLINKIQNSLPEAEFFDCKGFFINYKDSLNIDCNAGVDHFLDSININSVASVSRIFIGERLQHILDARGFKTINFKGLPETKYYVIFYFSKWTGKRVNREHIKEWIDKINEINKEGAIIEYLLLDMDYMDFWKN